MAATGEIVTFYSYKGGTGRSLILANVAWILASSGRRVLAVDWDLEAPGLHRYFEPFLADRELTSSDGIIDMVLDFVTEAVTPAVDAPEDWYRPYADIRTFARALRWDFGGGALHFVPAGRQGASYATRVNSFDWESFYDQFGGGAFLEAVKEVMRAHYDYVLIDSRTGVSDTSGICTVQMPDTLVACFTLNNQGIEGAAAVARSALAQRDDRSLRVLPIPMRVEPTAEKDKADARREYAREQFAGLPNDRSGEALKRYWADVQVLYVPFYAFDEILAVFADPPGEPYTILEAAERITSQLTNGSVRGLAPMDEQNRRRGRAAFENRRQAPPARLQARVDVYVSYNTVDADSAERLAQLTLDSGLRPWLDSWNLPAGATWADEASQALEAARTCAVVLGPSGLAPRQHADLEHALQRIERGEDHRVFAVLLPGADPALPATGLPPALQARQWIDLRGGLEGSRPEEAFVQAVSGSAPDTGERARRRGAGRPAAELSSVADPMLANRLAALSERLRLVEGPWLDTIRRAAAEAMDDGDELLRQVEYRLVRQGRDIRRETDALLDHLRASDVPPADRLWDRYRALDGDGTALLSSGLDLLDGIAMRSRGLDDGAVDIAHALVAQLARQALAQPPVAVVPRASTGSDLTRLGVVGLEEADWSIWTLPMVAGEYGSVMATGDPLREVVDTVAGSAPFWASQPVVVRLTADAFATYTVGPAYPLAAIRLRLTLPPDEATLLRADVMLATLSEMSRRDTSDQISALLEQLTGSWEALCRELAYRPSSQVADPRATELADALREAFEVMLFPGAQYDARRATRLALQWRDMADLSRRLTIDPAETDVRDILNAAWIMRESDPASAPEVADAARAACLDVARRQRSSGLTALRL